MESRNLSEYEKARESCAYIEQKRGLVEVSGREAVQFLNGLITNDVAKLEEDAQMSAAFPNAQGRLLAAVRVTKKDGKFLFETEAATREIVFNNLFRFTYAGDFFVEDLSDNYKHLELFNAESLNLDSDFIEFQSRSGKDIFVSNERSEDFINKLKRQNAVEISDELYEVLRIENGIPKYGVDMDDATIVPEVGLPEAISYNKGCYIGQEIIARIHFRGHIAKQLTGLIFEDENVEVEPNDELNSVEGKNAGRITSVTFSPKLKKTIALAFVRYDYLKEGTQLTVNDFTSTVKNLPFVESVQF